MECMSPPPPVRGSRIQELSVTLAALARLRAPDVGDIHDQRADQHMGRRLCVTPRWLIPAELWNYSTSVSPCLDIILTTPHLTVIIMSRVTCLSTLLLASASLISAEEDYMESPADPRLFFGNVTASENEWHKWVGECLIFLVTDLLPVNVTLAAYGAAIIVGGSILGLLIYFLATQVRTRTCLWY